MNDRTHDKIDRRYQRGATTRWACICGYEGYSADDVDDHILAMIDPETYRDEPKHRLIRR